MARSSNTDPDFDGTKGFPFYHLKKGLHVLCKTVDVILGLNMQGLHMLWWKKMTNLDLILQLLPLLLEKVTLSSLSTTS